MIDLNDLGSIDLGFTGYPYTWNNKRKGTGNIQQRLDKAIVKFIWCTRFPKAIVHHFTAIASNYCPITLDCIPSVTNLAKPFKFEAMWLQDDVCFDVVHNSWNMFFMVLLSIKLAPGLNM